MLVEVLVEMKCDYCGREIKGLPYRCKYCGGTFCVEHHLPEKHNCPGLKRGEWRATPVYVVPRRASTPIHRKRASAFAPPPRASLRISREEALDIALAVGAISIVYLSMAFRYLRLVVVIYILLSVILAFLVHEMAHKYTAINFGYLARFKATKEGLLITVLSALLPIKIIAPGYVAVHPGVGLYSPKRVGLVALVGPLSNVFLSLLGFALAGYNWLLGYFMSVINADIALFNMLPLPVLDGSKIAAWSWKVWLASFAPVLALWLSVRFVLF